MSGASHAALYDPDADRARRTDQLLHELGQGLHVDTRALAVHTDADAIRRTAGESPGRASAHMVMLHPGSYDARSRRSRELLAHEVVHVAQARNPAIDGVGRSRAAWLAEVEAGSVARDFAAGRPIDTAMLGWPGGQWAGFSLPDLASMEQLKRIKLAVASSVRSRVGNRPLAAFVVRSMMRWADGDLRGVNGEDADLAMEVASSAQTQDTSQTGVESGMEPSRRQERRDARRDGPERFRSLRSQERVAIREQRSREREIRAELRSEREERRESAGRPRIVATDVVLALTRALTGVGAEALHATPIFPMRLAIHESGVDLEGVADVRFRGIEVSGAIATSFLGIPIRIGDAALPPAGSRDRPALRRARQLALNFPWFSTDAYGTLPATDLPLFASGPGYVTTSHLVLEWMELALPGISLGIPGVAEGLLDVVDWGGEKPKLKLTGVDLGPGRGVPFGSIGFADGPVGLSVLSGLLTLSGLDVTGGEITGDGGLRLSLAASQLQLLGGRVAVAGASITYDSRGGLRVAFGATDLGIMSVQSGEFGPGLEARFTGGRIGFKPLEFRFQQLLIGPGGSLRFVDPRPASLESLARSVIERSFAPIRAVAQDGGQRRTDEETPPAARAPKPTVPPTPPSPGPSGAPAARETLPRPRRPIRRKRWEESADDAEREQRIHIVKQGESLSLIARQYYGDVTKYREIAEANGIPGPDYSIEVGQSLTIPEDVAERAAGAEPSPGRELKPERGSPSRAKDIRLPRFTQFLKRERRRAEADAPQTVDESAAPVPDTQPALENSYVVKDPKAYIRDENGNLLPEKRVIPKWTPVTLLETRSVESPTSKAPVTIAKVSYEEGKRTVVNWTNMSNLYAQFWNPEAHREDYLEVDPGYAQAMLAVDPKATRAALMKSGPGVRALIDQFYPNSTDIADLSSEFRPKLTRFLEFLREQGITESIAATLRHPLRSLVFDSAIRAASSEDGLMRAQVQCIRYGVPIDWHHYRDDGTLDVTKSQSMAAEVKKEFGIGSKASRGVEDELGGVISRHNLGNGVDMHLNFSFSRKAIEKDGKTYVIRQDEETPTRLANGSWWLTNCGEKPLARLGNDVFGVTRVLEDDAIHWSATGR